MQRTMRQQLTMLLLMLGVSIALVLAGAQAQAATCTVNVLTDTGAGSGGASGTGDLRYCINQTNQSAGADTINVTVTGTIQSGILPLITDSLTINGSGQSALIVNTVASGDRRVFQINASSSVTVNINNLTATGGVTPNFGGGIVLAGGATLNLTNVTVENNQAQRGGGIYVENSTLKIVNSRIIGNRAVHNAGNTGGGITILGGTFTMTGSTVDGNSIQSPSLKYGGGLAFLTGTSAHIENSVVSNNTGADNGGGIYVARATFTMIGSTVNGNSVLSGTTGGGYGGGLTFVEVSPARVENSLVSNNTGAISGGGIHTQHTALLLSNVTISGNVVNNIASGLSNIGGTLTLRNCTIARNVSTANRSAVYVPNGIWSIANTIVAENLKSNGDPSINIENGTTLTQLGVNIVRFGIQGGTVNGSGTVLDVDPLLNPLTDNGGLVRTHSLQPGSPAINAGDNSEALDTQNQPQPLTTDARGTGFPRIVGGTVDIGSFEAAQVICAASTAEMSGGGAIRPGQAATVAVTVSGGSAPYTITLSNNGGTQTGNGPVFNFSVSPSTTTAYSVAEATDNNDCPLTAAGSATVTVDGTPPTIACPTNQIGVIAGTSGPVTYPAPTVSDNHPGAMFNCVPASGATFALGVTTVNCTARDGAGNTALCSFTVTVRQVRPAIKDLIKQVQALVPPLTQAGQLISQLELAATRVEQGQSSQACTHLQTFVNRVNSFVSNRQLTTAQGQALISYANKIRNALGCAGSPF